MKKALSVVFIVLIVTWFLGPRPEEPDISGDLPAIEVPTAELGEWIIEREASDSRIKPENDARVIYADSSRKKTPYSLVYLHGWSASRMEGNPVHREIASRYGMNLFLSRLNGHGLSEEEPMLNITVEKYLASAREALAIGKLLGEKVILMGTSTGATLALTLASQYEEVEALILYSPNITIANPAATLLNNHWGLQIARMVKGGSKYHEWGLDSIRQQYWTSRYRLEAAVQLQQLLESTMTEETFTRVNQPVFMGYYYKNEEEQDRVVSVSAMKEMFNELGTADSLKRSQAFPEAGHHVIGSILTSRDVEGLITATEAFMEEVLLLKPAL